MSDKGSAPRRWLLKALTLDGGSKPEGQEPGSFLGEGRLFGAQMTGEEDVVGDKGQIDHLGQAQV